MPRCRENAGNRSRRNRKSCQPARREMLRRHRGELDVAGQSVAAQTLRHPRFADLGLGLGQRPLRTSAEAEECLNGFRLRHVGLLLFFSLSRFVTVLSWLPAAPGLWSSGVRGVAGSWCIGSLVDHYLIEYWRSEREKKAVADEGKPVPEKRLRKIKERLKKE